MALPGVLRLALKALHQLFTLAWIFFVQLERPDNILMQVAILMASNMQVAILMSSGMQVAIALLLRWRLWCQYIGALQPVSNAILSCSRHVGAEALICCLIVMVWELCSPFKTNFVISTYGVKK